MNGKIESEIGGRQPDNFEVSSARKETKLHGSCHLKGNSERKEKDENKTEMTEEIDFVPARSNRTANRKTRTHSRQLGEHHKCRKKSIETLLDKIDQLRPRNYRTNKRVNSAEGTEVRVEEKLSPLEMNLDVAYKHLKNENDKLKGQLIQVQEENDRIRGTAADIDRENELLREDVSLLKNLVYRLNLELERYQTGDKTGSHGPHVDDKLPKNYEKDFLRPLLPLLRAYAEALKQKDELIKELDSEYKKFNVAFADVLRENERLYEELEKKLSGTSDRLAFDEVNILKRDLDMAKQENNLLFEQINLEKEKLVKIHSTFKVKVEEAAIESEGFKTNLEECKTDLLVMRGKYAVLKQEFDRLKVDNEARIPLAVHTASISECRKLFDDLKAEYEMEKSRLMRKMKNLENDLLQRDRDKDKWTEEKLSLEKANFGQAFEIETLLTRVKELEGRLVDGGQRGGGGGGEGLTDRNQQEITTLKKQLGEANRKVDDLSQSLMTTRKKLQKAMAFAEEIVRGQETLLLRLHEKQKENYYMTTQFGNLKNQLKDVEKGAQESLNSVEEKMKNLQSENQTLSMEKRKLEKLLAEREDLIKKLEPTWKDSTS